MALSTATPLGDALRAYPEVRRNLDNPVIMWVKPDTMHAVTLPSNVVNLFARRRGLIADIRGMYAMIDDPAHAARHRDLFDDVTGMEDDLDSLNDQIARAMAAVLAA